MCASVAWTWTLAVMLLPVIVAGVVASEVAFGRKENEPVSIADIEFEGECPIQRGFALADAMISPFAAMPSAAPARTRHAPEPANGAPIMALERCDVLLSSWFACEDSECALVVAKPSHSIFFVQRNGGDDRAFFKLVAGACV